MEPMLNGPINWARCLIGPNSSAYFEAELSGTHCIHRDKKIVNHVNLLFIFSQVTHYGRRFIFNQQGIL